MKLIRITGPVCVALMLAGTPMIAGADSYITKAKVIDSTPIYESIRHRQPIEVCRDDDDGYQHRSSVTGAVVGSVIGAAIGSQVISSHHHHDAVAGTIVGGAVGAAIGSQAGMKPQYRPHRQCHTEYDIDYREELVGYRVTYLYQGKEYQTRMQKRPGRFVRLRVEVSLLDDY
ncbi:glycine zipper 2TM domain-containing protein [Gynuella sunshinyii]|uniref:Putative outer membrane lipoprotein n=1 Tax=Gynuella sunshinyii YC6258 TaxID=1445510 RepID=A0A0C5VEN8_9GAMM|nr:glycine zipper 2TM domain-containing protein [Gynuella sunshinyii]AJQ92666.1 putative outer membrane lipoprotein [Gynuella sunshinyii YC6258]